MSEATPRPYQAAKQGDSETFVGALKSNESKAYFVPEDVGHEMAAFLLWCTSHVGRGNLSELVEIRDQWEGGKRALSSKYFPKPQGADQNLWEQNKKLLTHVNLVGTAIRTWVNSVYADEAYRSARQCDDAVSDWIESDEFAASMYRWAEYKTAYGEAVAVPRWDEDLEELYTWLPDPVYTVIKYDDFDQRKVLGVAEIKKDRIDFVSVWGEGYISKNAFGEVYEEPTKLDWLPAIVGGRGTLPKVRDAVNATYAACTVMYNIRMLQKQQTRSMLVRKDELEKLNSVGAGKIKRGTDTSSIDLSKDGDAKFISPDPKIKESIEVLRQVIIILATASGIPADVLDPTLTESASSAEGSRIRAIPFIQNSKPLMRAWRSDERNVVFAAEYIMARVRNKPVKFKEVRKAVVVDIGLNPSVIPQSPNEEIQNIIAKVSFGLMTPEDAVRQVNYTKSKAQIIEMAEEMKRRLDEGARALEQKVLGGGRPPEQTGAGGSVNDEAVA